MSDLCEFRFDSGFPCHTGPEHDVHHGLWRGPEPNHRYSPKGGGKPLSDAEMVRVLRQEIARLRKEQPE